MSIRKSFFPGIVLPAQQIEGKYAKIGVFLWNRITIKLFVFTQLPKTFV